MTHQPQGDDALHTTERLARAIEHHLTTPPPGADPARIRDLADLARKGHFDEYLTTLAEPLLALVQQARALHLDDIAQRTIDGEFDATLAEAQAWRASPEGQRTFMELIDPDMSKAIEDDTGVWVTSDQNPDGTGYHTVLHVGDDYSRHLDTPAAHLHVRKVMEACAGAEFIAAAAAQLITDLEVDDMDAYRTVSDLREYYGKFSYAASGLTLAPGLWGGGQPFLHVVGPEGKWWRWRCSDAKLHALGVLETLAASGWDTAYRRYLTEKGMLDTHGAAVLVDGLGPHRRDEDRLYAHDEHPTRDRSTRTARARNKPTKKRRR